MHKKAFSIYVWFMYLFMYLIMLLPSALLFVITLPFDKDRKLGNIIFMLVGRSFLWFNPFWNIELRGTENFNPEQKTIFIANHQSFLDMPLLAALPWRMKWVSKEELFKIPVLGFYMRISGHISVKRGTTQALKALNDLKPFLSKNIPVMLFPEGTRSRTGELMKFKNGAFMLSKDTGALIQPILIAGTRNIIPPDTWVTSPSGKAIATIMPAYDPKDFDSVEAFRDKVYEDMFSELQSVEKFLK